MQGYLYQSRLALLLALRRSRTNASFSVVIEGLDDIEFETSGSPKELLQTKHHVKKTATLGDASEDLWSAFAVWLDGRRVGSIPPDVIQHLFTTAKAGPGSAASYLCAGQGRDVAKAHRHLVSIASTSTSKANTKSYERFLELSRAEREAFLGATLILDAQPNIHEVGAELASELFFVVEPKFLQSLLDRIEGWWYRLVIAQLGLPGARPILSEELSAQLSELREQFKQENLPIDEDVMEAVVESSGYMNAVFVKQLNLIKVGNARIFSAIRDYFRAIEHRSRWSREGLLLPNEIDRYHRRLVEKWKILFNQMADDLGPAAAVDARQDAAVALYKWVETNTHARLRPALVEASIARGCYHSLANDQRVGWHIDYVSLLKLAIESSSKELRHP